MKLFVETSDIREAEKLGRLPFIDGMCLNPARLKLYGLDDLVQLKGANKELLLDLNGEQWEDWFEEGMKLASLFETTEGVTFRVPATSGALQLASEFKVRSQNTCIRFINDIHQGYLSMQSGAHMLSIPLLELGERGINGLHLATELIRLRDRYGYTCRIMLSQVNDGLRLTEALRCGVDAVSISASLVYKMQQNLLDNQSASRYVHESKLHIMKVGDVMRTEHVRVGLNHTIIEATAEMTLGGLGAVAVVNDEGELLGVFTDGDLRRQLQSKGKEFLQLRMRDLSYKPPVSISETASLAEASVIFREKRIDNILVTGAQGFCGIIDIQDLNL